MEAKEFGSFLKKRREKAGISQETLAELVHISTTTIKNYEAGKCLPRTEHLIALVTTLKIPYNVVFGTKKETPNSTEMFIQKMELLSDDKKVEFLKAMEGILNMLLNTS